MNGEPLEKGHPQTGKTRTQPVSKGSSFDLKSEKCRNVALKAAQESIHSKQVRMTWGDWLKHRTMSL